MAVEDFRDTDKCLVVARALYEWDVREYGSAITTFDSLPSRTILKYCDAADFVISELESVV